MRITLVRHGETVGQSSVRYYGITDVALSNVGREQMRLVGQALARQRFGAVFTSRLSRSIEAASVIAPGLFSARAAGLSLGPPTAVAGFDEVNFGRWEGWTREEIAARDPVNYRLWQERRASFAYPEGESRAIFRDRVVAALHGLLAASTDDEILMVLHKGVIGVILEDLLALGADERARLALELGSIHVVALNSPAARAFDSPAARALHYRGTWRAEMLDRVDHLDAATADGR